MSSKPRKSFHQLMRSNHLPVHRNQINSQNNSQNNGSSNSSVTLWIIGLIVLSVLSFFIVTRGYPDSMLSNQFNNVLVRGKDNKGLPSHVVTVSVSPTLAPLDSHNHPRVDGTDNIDSEKKNVNKPTHSPLESAAINHLLKSKEKGAFDMHFIHIPKCGGTSMTAILREIACKVDSNRNADCCLNPGFCDFHAHRRCESIRGCINHIPQRPWVFKPPPSITILRDPVSRILSAWFYRGHSPNNDFFQVRPYFKDVRDGKLPRVEFDEYIEMIEYQNIQTRMLGADSFPYRNVTVDDQVLSLAKQAIDAIFFVGIQEAYDISVQILLREFQMDHLNITVIKERDQSNAGIAAKKQALKANRALMARTAELNHYDIELYKYGVAKFCRFLSKYEDLRQKMISDSRTMNICA